MAVKNEYLKIEIKTPIPFKGECFPSIKAVVSNIASGEEEESPSESPKPKPNIKLTPISPKFTTVYLNGKKDLLKVTYSTMVASKYQFGLTTEPLDPFGLEAGEYTLKIHYNDLKKLKLETTAHFTIQGGEPGSPQNLEPMLGEDLVPCITWEAPKITHCTPIAHYEIQISMNKEPFGTPFQVKGLKYVHTEAKRGNFYRYVVTAVNTMGYGSDPVFTQLDYSADLEPPVIQWLSPPLDAGWDKRTEITFTWEITDDKGLQLDKFKGIELFFDNVNLIGRYSTPVVSFTKIVVTTTLIVEKGVHWIRLLVRDISGNVSKTGRIIIIPNMPILEKEEDFPRPNWDYLLWLRRIKKYIEEYPDPPYPLFNEFKDLFFTFLKETDPFKPKGVFATARVERILRNAGAYRVSAAAIDQLNILLTERGNSIATFAVELARYSGRKTIRGSDIRLASSY